MEKIKKFISDNKIIFLMNILYFGAITVLPPLVVSANDGGYGGIYITILILLSMLFYIPIYGVVSVIISKKVIWPNVLLFVILSVFFALGADIAELVRLLRIPTILTLISTGISVITKLIVKAKERNCAKKTPVIYLIIKRPS